MHFRLFGIPVRVQPTFWLVSLMLSGTGRAGRSSPAAIAAWIGIVFVSILVHELGHAFAMRALGREPSIDLVGFGGLTSWGDGPRVAPGRVALVSLAGPVAGFVFAIPFAALHLSGAVASDPFLRERLREALFVNVGWGLFNLLPILPLDGGRVFECVSFAAFGKNGARGVYLLSIALGASLVLVAIRYQLVFSGIIAAYAIAASWRKLRAESTDPSVPEARTHRVDDETDAIVERAWDTIERGSADDAIALCESRLAELADDESTVPARVELLETIAWACLDNGDERAALDARARMPAGGRASAVLDARLLLSRGHVEEGLVALEEAYVDTPGDHAAIVVTAAYRDAGRAARVVELLRGLRGSSVSREGHRVIAASLFYADAFAEALAVAELAFARFSDPAAAFDAARCMVRLGRRDEALGWLEKAVASGIEARQVVASDPDLAPLAGDPRFDSLLARIPR